MIEAFSVAGEKFLAKRLSDLRVDSLDALPVALRRQIRKEKLKIDLGSVFGESVEFDDDGNPIEHGIGSPGNQTSHSIESFKKYNDCTLPANAEALKRMEGELAECNAKRAKARALKEADELAELEEMRRELGKERD
jgi:hypothetical protein